MNKYEKYLKDMEEIDYVIKSFDSGNKNIYTKYLDDRRLKENKWMYDKLFNTLKVIEQKEEKIQKDNISFLLYQLEIIKKLKEIKEKNSDNNDIYYLNLKEAKSLNLEIKWYEALRNSLLYCYKFIKVPNGAKENVYDLVIKSEGFTDENIIPALYILFCNEYKNKTYKEIVKDLNKKIEERKVYNK